MNQEVSPEEEKPIYRRWWFITLAVVLVVGFLASLGDDEDEAADTTVGAAETTAPGETTTTMEEESTTTTDATTTTTAPTTTTSPTTTTTAPATTTTAPTTTTEPGPETAFTDGTWVVGDEISPGVYQTRDEVSSCYWERLSGLGGTFEEIIANANVEGQGIVEIQEGDEAFSASGCGDWIELTALDEPRTSFGDGWWAVGDHIEPGRYRSEGGGDLCYWERLSGFSGEFGDIIANANVEGQALVEIASSDAGFHAQDCGTFEPVG